MAESTRFNLFEPTRKKDIRVGYISTDRGYVSNVSIYEANQYAKLQPGTQFILSTRDEVRYLNINEVNALEPSDILPKDNFESCGDITGIDPSIDLGSVNKIEVNFLGGGGIGAQGNAVVGKDGSILAVDLIHGGFGYQYPPLVEIKDTFGKAVRVNAQAFLGETATILETYTDEDEFENLDLETLIPNFREGEYGVRLDPVNGEVIGDWNPNDYANYFRDPIRSEILKYQEFIQRKSTGTWWDSRSKRPLTVVGENKNNNVVFPVEHWAWGGELLRPEKNTGLVPVEFEVYGQGSEKNRDLEFNFEAEDGSHSFTVKGVTHKNRSGKYRKVIKRVRVNTTYNVTSSRRRKVKNVDRAIEQGLVRESGGKSIERGEGTGKVIFADYVDSRNDNDDIQLTAQRGKFKSSNKRKIKGREGARDDGGTRKKNTYDLTYRLSFRDPTKRNPIEVVEDTFMNKYAISPVPDSEAEGSANVGKAYTFVWQEYFPYDGEYTFNALADSISNINFSGSEGSLWDFTPGQIKGLKRNRKDPLSITKTVKEGLYTITASLENSGPDEKERIGEPPKPVFDSNSSIEKADRKLYRAKPILGKQFSNFFNKYAVLPFDPQGAKKTVSEEPKVSFDSDGGKLFLKVTGSGRVKVDFRMKVNDNLITSGLALREVSIENDGDLLKLVRNIREETTGGGRGGYTTRYRGDERETITGSAEFTAGKTYTIKQIGGSSTSGFKPIDKTTVGFDDDINNGFDENVGLDITNVKVIGEEEPTISSDSYSGEHLIRWEKVEFPQDGNYSIRAAADNSARIIIGNVSGKGKIGIGNGLKNREKGGDEYIMKVDLDDAKSGPKTKVAFFEKGKYRIRVELTQKKGRPLQGGNPMGIALEIKTASTEQFVDAENLQTWQENPMGLALTINAPKAPVPKETPPPQEGRCPNNPMWTTRFRTGSDKWYPAYDSRWGTFMNRFAMSPIKPKSSPESSRTGEEFSKTWNVNIPYDGFYGVRGTCDNTGTITVGSETFPLQGFKKDIPKLNKVFLKEGTTDITVKVINAAQKSFTKKPKVIFDTADWVETAEEIDVDIIEEKLLCHAGGGFGGNSGKRQTKVGKVKKGKGGKGAPGEGEQDGSKGGNGGGAGLRNGRTAKSGKGGTIDGGFGVNLQGSERGKNNDIRSDDDDGGDGASYGGGGGGSRGKGRAGNGAGGAVKIIWGSTGKSVEFIKPGTYEVLVPQTEPGKLNRTSTRIACIGGGGSGYTDRSDKAVEVVTGRGEGTTFTYDTNGNRRIISIDTEVKEKMVKGGGGGSGGAYAYITERLVAGTRLEVVVGKGGKATKKEGSSDGEDTYVKILTTVIDKEADKPRRIKNPQGKGKIKYTGPLITSYKKKGRNPKDHLGPYLSPFFAFGRQSTDEIQGREWTFKWENVDFPIDGRYTFRTEADDKMVVRIDGRVVQRTSVEDNIEEKNRKFTAGKKTVEITLENSYQPGTNFVLNPVYCGLEILAQVRTEIDDQTSWKQNPVGASAILIPPPCPQEVGGIGIVTDVVVTTPGIGFSGSSGPGYPVGLTIKDIIIDNPGINYDINDPIIVTGGFETPDIILPTPNEPITPPPPVTSDTDGDGSSVPPGGGDGGGLGDSGGGGGSTDPGSGGGGGDIVFDPEQPGEPTGSVGGSGGTGGAEGGQDGTGDGVLDPSDPGSGGPGSGLPGRGRPVQSSGGRNPILRPILGPFGTVRGVNIIDPGSGFTRTPTISILSDTGVNAVLRPVFEIVRDPIGVDPETLIQVTDLVGLKQTGYIDGRAYYGQVFIKNGLRYAGVYETVGELVRVYDTLQESITGEVTTRPSAILRQGTDIQSNDPRLNLPGTPDNLT